jgi:hypothetical protein
MGMGGSLVVCGLMTLFFCFFSLHLFWGVLMGLGVCGAGKVSLRHSVGCIGFTEYFIYRWMDGWMVELLSRLGTPGTYVGEGTNKLSFVALACIM